MYILENILDTFSIAFQSKDAILEDAANSHFPMANYKMKSALLNHSLVQSWVVLYGEANSIYSMAEHCLFLPLPVKNGIEITYVHAVSKSWSVGVGITLEFLCVRTSLSRFFGSFCRANIRLDYAQAQSQRVTLMAVTRKLVCC
jgi:hypothetical protein